MVTHPQESAYSILRIPDYVGEWAECENRLRGAEFPEKAPTDLNYGKFFATGFHFKMMAGEPAVLYLVWAKESDQWKITAYEVIEP